MSNNPTTKLSRDETVDETTSPSSLPDELASLVQARPIRSMSLPAGTLLPSPVPTTGPPALPSLRYPHLSLPLNTPPYLFDTFTPSHSLLNILMDMGFTEGTATKALYWTGNSCIEHASNWLLERTEESLKTPLEVEVDMLKADLDMKEEESRQRMLSSDSGVHFMPEDDVLQSWNMYVQGEEMSDMSEDYELYKLVLVINKSLQLSPGQLTELVCRTTGGMVAKMIINEFGEEVLDMWDAMGQEVVVMQGENTKHLVDLKLAAECLRLDCLIEGRLWDNLRRHYREATVLAIWGEDNDVNNVVGRLVELE